MKKNLKYFIIIFIFSILIMIPSLKNGYYKGHDTNFHVANISVLSKQITWKNPLAKEPLPNIANNFGYGTRLFYPNLPHLMAAYNTKICNNVVIGMRLTQWITILASGITFFFLTKKIFKNKKIATLASLFYMSAPYHLSEIFIRDAFSEIFVPIAIPIIFLGLLYLLEDNEKKFFSYFTIGYIILLYSHLAMAIYFTLILIVSFVPIYYKKLFSFKNIKYFGLSSMIILCFTSPFWISILEHKINGSYAIFIPYYITGKGDLQYSAIGLSQYFSFLLPHTYNFIRYHLQLIVTIGLLYGIYYIFKTKLWKNKVWISILLFTIISFIMTTSIFPWVYTPDILQTLQFPWRLCIYVAFGGILIFCLCLKKIEKRKCFTKACIILGFFALIGSYYNTYHVSEEKVDLNQINYNLGMGNQEEYLPEKVIRNYEYYQNRNQEIKIISGNGLIQIINNSVPDLTFEIQEVKTIKIEFPRIFYLGYQLKKDQKEIPLKENENGFLEAELNENGIYELTYKGTKKVFVAHIMMCISGFFWLIIEIYHKKK